MKNKNLKFKRYIAILDNKQNPNMSLDNLRLKKFPDNLNCEIIKSLLEENINEIYINELLNDEENSIMKFNNNNNGNRIKISELKKRQKFILNDELNIIKDCSGPIDNIITKSIDLNDKIIIIWFETLNDDDKNIINLIEKFCDKIIKEEEKVSSNILCENWKYKGTCDNNCRYDHPDMLSYEKNKEHFEKKKSETKIKNYNYFVYLNNEKLDEYNKNKKECIKLKSPETSTTSSQLNYSEVVKKPYPKLNYLQAAKKQITPKKKEICGNWISTGKCNYECQYQYHPYIMKYEYNESEFEQFKKETKNDNYRQFLIIRNKPRELCKFPKCKNQKCNYIHDYN